VPTKLNLLGKKFRKMLVISEAPSIKIRGSMQTQWLCRCDCGVEQLISGGYLTDQRGRGSCVSCRRASRLRNLGLSDDEVGFRRCLEHYKRRAHQRGYSWELDSSQFRNLCTQPCNYCGCLPKTISSAYYSKPGPPDPFPFIRNGVDRIDNKCGYTIENSVTCCEMCNRMKMAYSLEEFLEKIVAIAARAHEKKIRVK
jgi:hypothetical protein